MNADEKQYPIGIAMMYAMSRVGNKKSDILTSTNEYLVTSGKFNDLGNELVIPDSLVTDAKLRYYGYGTHFTNEVLLMIGAYHAKKLEILETLPHNYEEGFKRANGGLLTFCDFHLCTMAAEYAERYLNYHDYSYEEYGFVELAAKVAVEMFKNYVRAPMSALDYDEYNLSKNPAGYYRFKDGFNVRTYMDSIIDDIDGIWQEEEDDEDDDDWE